MYLPKKLFFFLIGLFLYLVNQNCVLGVEYLDGRFLAIKDCPAPVSKARQTNPDGARLVPGRIYPLTAVNIADAPDAYRIVIKGATPEERWISADCGEYPPKSSPAAIAASYAAAHIAEVSSCPVPPPSKDACRSCGKANYFALALNWLPGMCELQNGKPNQSPECAGLDTNSYAAGNFTLGQLRPALQRCRKGGEFCGSVDKEASPHSSYPAITLNEDNTKALADLMPGTVLNSGQERDEWFRHGTCSSLQENAYFKLLADLTRQFNQSGISEFLRGVQGQKIRREDFFQVVEKALGKNARKHINIECSNKGKALSGVLVMLPSKTILGGDIKELIVQGPGAGARGNCENRFMVPKVSAQ